MAPLLAGPILCGSHVASVGVLLLLGLVHTTAVHSGYWICDDDGMHDEHHRQFNVNYGVVGIMDVWYGTYRLPAGAVGTAAQHKQAPEAEAAGGEVSSAQMAREAIGGKRGVRRAGVRTGMRSAACQGADRRPPRRPIAA
eukprot:CAMPEP_0198489010 /NCGR_PEP_ID=MMETSP1462-20131121/1153_1 /TAXON_ID=1333877 /ORGANISM="Brandtodinium nutriculum, Strain RCC3387" /LENGTH=139 /DNA_ID=CAMNT_0044217497 /DNA_START=92 /DNA_END=507 /DNA_ORIENTATION=-